MDGDCERPSSVTSNQRTKLIESKVSAGLLRKILKSCEDSDMISVSMELKPKNIGISVTKKYENLATKLACMLYEARNAVKRLAEIEEERAKHEKSVCFDKPFEPEIYYDKRAGFNTGAHGLLKDVEDVLNEYEVDILKLACEGE